eukprot:1232326-Rhodomonas_salina.1
MLALRLSFAMCALLLTACPSVAVSKVTLVVFVVVSVRLLDVVQTVRREERAECCEHAGVAQAQVLCASEESETQE